MTHTDVHRGDIDWPRGVLVGAVAGGIGWGLFAAATLGAGGDQAHLNTIIGPDLGVAVGISMLCLIVAAVLGRARVRRTAAVALAVAPASGWIILALVGLQVLVMRP
jgi:hypothetical protein